jgi:hypothetical protein
MLVIFNAEQRRSNWKTLWKKFIDKVYNINIISTLAGKQDTLISGTNIKTIDGNSILGSGDLPLNEFTDVLKGLAPASGGGTTSFLRADGNWAAPGGGGISDTPQAWSSTIDFDGNYGSFNTNAHTQSGNITFTINWTGAVFGAVTNRIIESNGDTITIPEGVESIINNATGSFVDREFTPVDGNRYRFIFECIDVANEKYNCLVIDSEAYVEPVQLNAPVLTSAIVNGSGQIDLTFTDTNTDPNEVEVEIEYDIVNTFDNDPQTTTAVQDATTKSVTGLDPGTEYFFRVRAVGDGMTTLDSEWSNIESETTGSYVFENTYKMIIDALGEGVQVLNDDCYPSDGDGNDEDVSFEFWFKTPDTLVNSNLLASYDGANILFNLRILSTGTIVLKFKEDASNILQYDTGVIVSVNTLYHFIFTKSSANVVTIYVNSASQSLIDNSIGSYTGLPTKSGTLALDIGNYLGATACIGEYQIFRQFNKVLTSGEATTLYNSGTPVGLTVDLIANCVQENLFNNTPDADNIGVDGTNQGTVTYSLI